MDTKFFDEYQKQLREWQKKLVDTWIESLPNGKKELNFSENFEKALKLQEEAVKTYLEVQEKTTQTIIESQKQFWTDYFEMMRTKAADKTPAGVG
jgi:hypothetical protein